MSKIEQLRMSGAAEQARAIAHDEIDSAAIVAAEAAAIAKRNPLLNAFVQIAAAGNHDTSESRSALSGTTFAVKDNIDVTGLPTHAGLAALQAVPAERDATVVARLKQAGLVFAGKTNMSPVALGASTHNEDFGHCYNPLREGYSAGGSSGGSASAVAAGLVGIALGTDTMGSVRIPAAFCGTVGFKPSWGRLPVQGLIPLCRSLDSIGVLSRTVEDAALAFSILRDYRGDSVVSGSAQATRNIGVLGVTPKLQLQADVESAYITACNQLEAQGYDLNPVSLSGVDLSRVRRAGLLLSEAELLSTLENVYPEHKPQIPEDLVNLLDYIQHQSARKLGQANASLAESRRIFESWFDGVDAVVLPTCAHTAFSMDGPVPADVADLTVAANVLGAPAISLPLAVPEGGLPSGLQMVGRYGEDERLLSLAEGVNSLLHSVVG